MDALVPEYWNAMRVVVLGCGVVSCGSGGTSFGNGRELKLVVETGGREARIYAEMELEEAERLAMMAPVLSVSRMS